MKLSADQKLYVRLLPGVDAEVQPDALGYLKIFIRVHADLIPHLLVNPLAHSLTRSLTNSLTNSLSSSRWPLNHSLSLTRSFPHSLALSLALSLAPSLAHSHTHSLSLAHFFRFAVTTHNQGGSRGLLRSGKWSDTRN